MLVVNAKKTFSLLLLQVVLCHCCLFFFGFFSAFAHTSSPSPSVPSALASPLRVGLLLDKGGRDDRSFNTLAYEGVRRAQEELGIKMRFVEPVDDNSFEALLRGFARRNFQLIISVGASQVDALKRIAPQFPDQHFAIIDAVVEAPNIQSVRFEEHEGSFLVGALAALSSRTQIIGFIGGMDVPIMRRFQLGFISGARKLRPGIQVLSNFIGVTGDSWNNPAKGKELAISQYDRSADVIFAAAGASSIGVFDAAEEKKKFAIGVDSNQNWIKPGFILTSMVKNLSSVVFQLCKEEQEGHFTRGVRFYNLKNNGVDYSRDQFNKKLITESAHQQIKALKEQIISGQVLVPDYYKQAKESLFKND